MTTPYQELERRIGTRLYYKQWYLKENGYEDGTTITLELEDSEVICSAPRTPEGYDLLATQILLLFG